MFNSDLPREQGPLELLDGAARRDDLAIPAGSRLERLKGQRAEPHSIRVTLGSDGSAAPSLAIGRQTAIKQPWA